MGTTLQNIYLFPSPDKKELVAGLQRHFKTQGYKVAKAGDAHDMSLRVYCQPDKPCYVSVESLDTADTKGSIAAIGEYMGCDVLGASVYDSDFLSLYYFSDTVKQVVELALGHTPDGEFLRNGDIGGLVPLLADPEDSERLAEVWAGEYVYEDLRLSDMLVLFGCDDSPGRYDEKARLLRFTCLSDQELGYAIIKEGKPKFSVSGDIYLENKQPFSASFHNTGGPSIGFSVCIKGELLDRLSEDLPEIMSFVVSGYKNPSPLSSFDCPPEFYSIEARPSKKIDSDGRVKFEANFPKIAIPNGLVIDFERRYSQAPPWARFNIFFRIVVHITVSIPNYKDLLGSKLGVIISPHENWLDGQACGMLELIN